MNGQPIGLSPYPVDGELLGALSQGTHNQPTAIAQEALLCWNRYLAEGAEQQRADFLERAAWLLEQATACAGDGAGWPVLTRLATLPKPTPLLSATTQGLALSVLARAYRLTGDETYWSVARRAVRAFERDIFDGGVSAPVGSAGLFFEAEAAYPASHQLIACLIALCGLYDYLAVAEDAGVAALAQRCLATLADLASVFDAGYWSRADLASRRLASPPAHALHIALLQALALASGDAACARLVARWVGYQHAFFARLRYLLSSTTSRWQQGFWGWFRQRFFRSAEETEPNGKQNVCVAITGFPLPGGMRSVLAGVAKAMASEWKIEYLTRQVGPNPDGLTIRSFGPTLTSNWHFPTVWFYVFAGWRRQLSLLRQRRYHLVFPQDGVFTGAYAALAARMAGVRVVCADHGNIPQLFNGTYRTERLKALEASPWPLRQLQRLLLACYWPSLRLLARISTRAAHGILAAGDDIEVTYRQHLGVSSDRIIRQPYLIDTERYAPRDALAKVQQRERLGLPADSILIAMVNRLAPEKAIDIALQGISRTLERLPSDLGSRVRLAIAGDGPLRAQIEAEIRQHHLESTCLLLGVVTPDEVAQLLGTSDLFLFTATRDSNSVAVLEAMAAGLPVISSAVPPTKAALLGEGRGIVVPADDIEAVALALEEALRDPQRGLHMGSLARAYIEAHHSTEVIRQSLLRATGWPLAASTATQPAIKDHPVAAEQGMS